MLDDWFAAMALEHTDAVLRRNRAIVRGNLAVLDAGSRASPHLLRQAGAGTTALLASTPTYLTRALRAAAGGGPA